MRRRNRPPLFSVPLQGMIAKPEAERYDAGGPLRSKTLAGRFALHKSLPRYRECSGRKFRPQRNKVRAAAVSTGGDLKEVAVSTRYGAIMSFPCNEALAGGLRPLREANSILQPIAARPEDSTSAAVAGGHFVQARLPPAHAPLDLTSPPTSRPPPIITQLHLVLLSTNQPRGPHRAARH